jgi:hypothetical protein
MASIHSRFRPAHKPKQQIHKLSVKKNHHLKLSNDGSIFTNEVTPSNLVSSQVYLIIIFLTTSVALLYSL